MECSMCTIACMQSPLPKGEKPNDASHLRKSLSTHYLTSELPSREPSDHADKEYRCCRISPRKSLTNNSKNKRQKTKKHQQHNPWEGRTLISRGFTLYYLKLFPTESYKTLENKTKQWSESQSTLRGEKDSQ